jgi:Rps23 Pro-64 3,4-dihydroxylase Tpa1-like proline 4-hydroxylase
LYLSNNYKSGDGGEFNILDENNLIKETITPEFGNVVVLDFTENNVNHSVNRVLRDYGRNALISFVYKK